MTTYALKKDTPEVVFSACPHDVFSDPEKWTAFTRYLIERLEPRFRFKLFAGFDEFSRHFADFGLVYVHPLHAVQLSKEYGYIPLAKYADIFDEAVVVVPKVKAGLSIRDLSGGTVACVYGSPSHAALLIDLAHQNPTPVQFIPNPCDSYPSVLMSVAVGESAFGIILKSVWDDMITLKERVAPIYVTELRELVHVFMLAPSLKDRCDTIRRALLEMHHSERGQKILRRLKCRELVPFDSDSLTRLAGSLEVCLFD